MNTIYPDATEAEIDEALHRSMQAFEIFKQLNGKERSRFLHVIADEMGKRAGKILQAAEGETKLAAPRLKTELDRTLFQLRSYGDACAAGQWLDIRINTADTRLSPPRPDLRKLLIPLGPVVVFGA